MAFSRVPVTSVPLANFADGQVLFGADVNIIVDVFKTAINANGGDIATILSGDRDANVVTTFAALSLIEDPETNDKALVLNDEEQEGQTSLYNFNGTVWVLVYQISIAQMKEQLDGVLDGTTTAAFAAGTRTSEGVNSRTALQIATTVGANPQNTSIGAANVDFANLTLNNLTIRNQAGTTSTIDFADAVTLNATQAHIDNTTIHFLKTDVTKSDVGLGNVTNESKATMFTDPTFTGTVTGVTATHVGLGNANNTSDADKPVSTATQTELDGKQATLVSGTNIKSINSASILASGNLDLIAASEKGAAGGVATLDAITGKVPASQLPAFVDDLEEYATKENFPVTGDSDKIYVAINTGKIFRWSGTQYVEIAANEVNSVNGKAGIVVLDKTDIGLGNVANTAQVTAVTATAPIESSGGTTPTISIVAATDQVAGSMSAADKTKLDALAASTLDTDVTNFAGILSATEDTVQKALDILDDHDHVVADITDLSAATVTYDNAGQNLVATDVQAAINEIDDLVEEGLTQVVVVKYTITDADDGTGGFTFNRNDETGLTGAIDNGEFIFPLPSGISYITGGNRLAVKIDGSDGALKRLFFGADDELIEPNSGVFRINYAIVDNDVLYAKLYQSLATVSLDIADGSVTESKIANGAVTTNKLANNAADFTKIQQVATNRILGNDTAGTANVKALTVSETKVLLALNNVDNTTDLNKPISSNTQTALDLKANVSHSHVISDVTNLQTTLDGKATTVTFAGTILAAATWTDQTGFFTTSITVNGITATDNPIVDLNLASATVANIADIQAAWGTIYRVVTSTDTLTFHALEAPTFPENTAIQIKVVR